VQIFTLPGVFRPRSDSLVLGDHVASVSLPADARVLDLCTGSGVVALSAARRHDCEVYAVDISRRSVLTVKLNAALMGVQVQAVRGDMFEAVPGLSFDLIASNPPYLPNPDGNVPAGGPARAWDAGITGRVFLDRICAQAPAHLRPGGSVMLIHSSVCGEQATLDALTENGLRTSVVYRAKGPLGPLLAARRDWLQERGLIGNDGLEEILIIRGQKPEAQPSLRSSLTAAAASASR
jgi:release factor glutamine methyltransferase